LGDAAMVFVALMLAYVLRFESPLREFGVDHPGMDLQAYLGHVVFGGVLMLGLLANFRIHDPRNFLAIRRTFALVAKTCVIWLVGFLGLALVLKIEPAISRL